MDLFFRSERTNWRELGDYDTYPTLRDYIHSIIPEKYGTSDIEEACNTYLVKTILPNIIQYDEAKYYPYPEMIRNTMAMSETFS